MRCATLFLPLCITQLMNLPASFELKLGSGRRCVLLAVNFRDMNENPRILDCGFSVLEFEFQGGLGVALAAGARVN